MKKTPTAILFALAITPWCWNIPIEAAPVKPAIYSVNYPLAYFAERIGGDSIKVVFPEIEGDPAFWDPDREAVMAFQQADLILLNGANYAKWIHKVSLPYSKLVDTSTAFKNRLLTRNNIPSHQHGPQGDHTHEGIAFTVWIDPQLAILQAEAITKALQGLLPDQKERFGDNFIRLKSELNLLDQELENLFSKNPDLHLIVSHPVYEYLAKRYNLNFKSVMWEPHQPITESQWNDLLPLVENSSTSVMMWEDEPLPESVGRLNEIHMKSITFSPCGNRPKQGDFMEVMHRNLSTLSTLYD